MREYLPPCFSDECDMLLGESEVGRNLCKVMSDSIIKAGGASLLEVTICPTEALRRIGPEQSDPDMIELRSKLGISEYWEDPSFD